MRRVVLVVTFLFIASCEQDSLAPRATPSSGSPTTATPIITPEPEPSTARSNRDSGVYAIVEKGPACARRQPKYRRIALELDHGDTAVLTAAVQGVLQHWFDSRPRVAEKAAEDISVSIESERAVIDVLDWKHVSWASTACGSSIFVGDLVHTALQFPTVRDVEFRYRGSCTDWGKYMQAGPLCFIYSLDDRGQVSSVRRKDS